MNSYVLVPILETIFQLQGQFSFRPSSMEGCSQERDSSHNVISVSEIFLMLFDKIFYYAFVLTAGKLLV